MANRLARDAHGAADSEPGEPGEPGKPDEGDVRRLPVIEEFLQVDKALVDQGGVRLTNRVETRRNARAVGR